MLSLKDFKLTNLAENEIIQKSQSITGGAGNCGCACAYADTGGSSTCGNSGANYNGGLTSGPNSPSCGRDATYKEQQFLAC